VDRYIGFFREYVHDYPGSTITKENKIWKSLHLAILNLEVMPSMRCMMTAGPALARDHTSAYNCAFLTMNHPTKFSELMHVLMCGTGAGYSVERQYVNELPQVSEDFFATDTVLKVSDSKAGWCRSFKELIGLLYSGQIPEWDMSAVRPAGARLKTFGGRASGPEPLDDLFKFCIETFKVAAGRRLTSLEVSDICCKVADIVVVGGVRRSALLSLSNLTDERMRAAKSGEFYHLYPHRTLANNSVCYTEKPDMGIFIKEWESLYASKSGERGIFNLAGVEEHSERHGPGDKHVRKRDADKIRGTNPCSEILLRDRQFCNLTEVIVRKDDTYADLRRKARLATIMGTFQCMLTDFKFLSKKWKENCEEERLLGVSLTGIMDHDILSSVFANPAGEHNIFGDLRNEVIKTNIEWAGKLGINASVATTCVKPSGTVSQLCDTSSGIHPRYASHYIRRVRNDRKDPVSDVLIKAGVPWEEDVINNQALVFSFPMKAPNGSVMRDDMTAIEQLEHWKLVDEEWCEHKASVTIYVREHEWLAVGAWVYEHFDNLSGVSFLPHSDHIYKQAPYEEISEEAYVEMVSAMPETIEWEVALKELEDNTTASQELACTGGACEI